ncbi:uncharacterized protein PG986_008825 [Apiospora aurea]|uniref:Uncharacterized protein n=1 Tax=Apiospora aurea TaxID=335848 RepID=A0ABR1Q6D8_9PEZI
MSIWAVAVALLALLAPFGKGLPIEAAVFGSAAGLGSTNDTGNISLPDPLLFSDSGLPGPGSREESTPARLVARAPQLWDRPRWPFDDESFPGVLTDPYVYLCNQFARQYNQIPDAGLTARSTAQLTAGQSYAQAVAYSQEEIYQAFRAGGSILWSSYQDGIIFQDWQTPFGGVRWPRPLYVPPSVQLAEVPIGLGTWFWQGATRRGAPRYETTTDVYEYPLVSGGVWPRAQGDHPGPDRVLFQLVRGAPLYIGVITWRGVYPNPTPQQQRPLVSPPPSPFPPFIFFFGTGHVSDTECSHRWAYIALANGRHDEGAIGTMLYPGQDGASEQYPNAQMLSYRRRQMQKKRSPDDVGGGYEEGNPPPSPPPPPPTGPGGGGTGAGGGSGNLPNLPAGGISISGGGSLGGSGSFGDMQYGIQAGNVFRKNQPLILPGPSHIEL